MDDDEVSYETLQDMLRNEKRSNRLVIVPDGFWRNLQHFLQDIESEFMVEQGKDPFSRKASMFRDRVVHAQQAADGVWTLRERKIAMLALAHAKEGGEPKGLTSKEKILYTGLHDLFGTARQGVFAGTGAETALKAARAMPSPKATPEPEPVPRPEAPVIESEPIPEPVVEEVVTESVPPTPAPRAEVPPDIPHDDQVTIEALGDIPPFVGPDMQTYILKQGDMATVPQNIAALLVKRNKAKIVQTV